MRVTEIHSEDEAHLSRVLHFDEDGMVLTRSPARTRVGRHVWLEFAIEGAGRIRVLGEVVGRGPDSTRVRFKHMWPRDRVACQGLFTEALAA